MRPYVRAMFTGMALSAISVSAQAQAMTARELLALSADRQAQQVATLLDNVAATFRQEDGGTVRSNCIGKWYGEDPKASNASVLRNLSKFPDHDAGVIVKAVMVKVCGKDKDEGMQILRERVAGKLEAHEEAARRAQAKAERELEDIDRRAWRLPDGRRIYEDKNGRWRFKDGAFVPAELARTRVPPP